MTLQDLKQAAQYVRSLLGNGSPAYLLAPFVYHINYLPAVASTTTDGNFITQADSGFAIAETTAIVTDTSDAVVANLQPFGSGVASGFLPFLITMTDSGSGRQLQNLPVPLDGWFGTAQFPRRWPVPFILDPNSQFTVSVQNLSATDRRVRLSFHGMKIFSTPGSSGAVDAYRATLR